MRLEPLQQRTRVYLSPSEYEFLLECAPTKRCYFATRIEAECSPRIGIVADIERGDFYVPSDPGVELTFLKLRGTKDTRKRDSSTEGKARITWVPDDLYEELMTWADQKDCSEGDQLFDIGAATLQNDIKIMRQNAAHKSGNKDFLNYSSHDGRVYYATDMVRRKRVDIEIVMEMGGWSSKEAIEPYLRKPLAKEIQDELVRSGAVNGDNLPAPPRRDEFAGIHEELRKIRQLIDLEEDSPLRGLTVDELAEFRERMLRENSEESEPTRSTLSDFKGDPAALDPVSAFARARLRAEHAAARASDAVEHYPPPPKRAAATAIGLGALAALSGVIFAQTGAFYFDPISQDVHASPGFVIGLLLGAALITRELPDLDAGR